MNPTHTTPLEPGNRVQLPADWADALGLHGQVTLERTSKGILIRSGQRLSWDDIFATKLVIGRVPAEKDDEDFEVTGDDLLS